MLKLNLRLFHVAAGLACTLATALVASCLALPALAGDADHVSFRAQVAHMHADASRTAAVSSGLLRDGHGYILRGADTPRVTVRPA